MKGSLFFNLFSNDLVFFATNISFFSSPSVLTIFLPNSTPYLSEKYFLNGEESIWTTYPRTNVLVLTNSLLDAL